MNLTITRLVVCGDSLSVGVGDPAPRGARQPGDLYGWVHHLVERQPTLELVANLARVGATASRVRRTQLPLVAQHTPDIVSCIIGVNDVMSSGFDADAFEENYDAVISGLAGIATRGVFTATLHDVAAGLPISGRRRAALRSRTAAANAVIERVGERYSTWLFDVRIGATMGELNMLSADRLHPNGRGHQYLAAHVAEVLGRHGACPPGMAATIPPPWPAHRRIAHGVRHARWLITNVLWPRWNRSSPRGDGERITRDSAPAPDRRCGAR
ncbi:SGNH/GDSL hydrolase family protein [Phytoactinopolyspora mesophila]|uniref:SGNH/GDSL hydrolase family protein n=1 Tax=Phytoactinopolyspora mesophila TaxID=2650750 RepID=A0A7K3M1C0_9ACTN|nr:SGNH/GDSL hydrolase family protein [Phytoactinopolyspora mesophila]NDL57074.1 SGNH/GDSL hydrolase family protein [Phytoactinopolyspora mesophila]